MRSEIKYAPSYSLAIVTLDPGESIQAEAGSMVSMSPGIEIETKAKGGLLGGLKRSVLGGESFFLNTFTAASGGQITIAPSLPGDIQHMQLSGQPMFIQSGSYMASAMGVEIDTKWGGAKTFFSSEGLFLLKASGMGDLFVSSYGAIHELDLTAGEHYLMDTGHMVAFTEGTGYEVKKVGGWKSTLLSGEGLVVDLTGPGKVYMQTRSPQGFLSWLIPQLPKSGN
ncbi:MAG: TIGR00266 family protein [Actinomycetota bacterium]|nr:TIGR00266 family protein [Actinomycetota bacterium]